VGAELLPSIGARLPSIAAHLPSIAAHLPSLVAHLPSIAAHLHGMLMARQAEQGPGVGMSTSLSMLLTWA
jgi:hypothetical protein